MSTDDYLFALQSLGLAPFGLATRSVLGLQARQLARLAAGSTAPSAMLIRLLEALIKLKTV
jgi:hypothetical protein